jgi:hypothetical protein
MIERLANVALLGAPLFARATHHFQTSVTEALTVETI